MNKNGPGELLIGAFSKDSLGFIPTTTKQAALLFFPSQSRAFIFILMQTEGSLTSDSLKPSYILNWALQETDALGLLCPCV